jgi:PmbA protein
LRCPEAEVFVCLTTTRSLSVEHNKVLGGAVVRDSQVFVRAVDDKRMGVAFTNSLDAGSLRRCASAARRLARVNDADPQWTGFAARGGKYPVLKGIRDESISSVTLYDLAEAARTMMDSALDEAVGITVTSSQIETVTRAIAVGNTSGMDVRFCDAHISATCSTVSGHGSSVSPDCYDWRVSRSNDLDYAALGASCASTARDCAVTAEPRTEESQVVFAQSSIGVPFNGLLNIILTKACSGESALHKTTFFWDRVGQRVGPRSLTIRDDPLKASMVGSRPFDDEGVPSRKTSLVEDGIYKGFLWNTRDGSVAGKRSTGNAMRDMSTGHVTSAPLNISITPGKGSLRDLISEVDHGYLVWGCQGAHTSNVETGDFSFVASPGFLIERGSVVGCVKGAMLSGNLLSLFSGIEKVGGDPVDFGNMVCPSLLVGGVKVTTG